MWPTPKTAFAILSAYGLLLQGSSASPVLEAGAAGAALAKRQCPPIHVFGARETTVASGYGSSATVVDLILNAHPGATSEAINYPACGGQSSCGGVSYASSVVQGISAVVSAVESFNSECPSTQLVLVGYSQGGQIMDDALCGGGDPDEGYTNTAVPLSAAAVNAIKAAIFMGDPRYQYGESYEVGTCTAGGFAARQAGFTCPSASKVQSYCDSSDPYCCNGDNAATHQGYGTEYGQAALTFVNSRLSSSGTSPTTTTSAGSSPTGGSCSALYGQCGGIGWTGATCCAAGSTCQEQNSYFYQCLA